MLTAIGAHFPILVIVAMAIFAAALASASIEDAIKARGRRPRA